MYPGVPVRVPIRLDPVELYTRVYSKGRLLVGDNLSSEIPQDFEYSMNLGKNILGFLKRFKCLPTYKSLT